MTAPKETLSLSRAAIEGAVAGAGFGLFASATEVALWTIGRLSRGLGTPRDSLVLDVVASIGLGLLLGALTSPLRRGRSRATVWLQGAAIFSAWAALGVLAGLPSLPGHLALTVAPWVVALALFVLVAWLSNVRPDLRRVVPASLLLLLAGCLAAPTLIDLVHQTSPGPSAGRAPPAAPDVLIVVLDTVRADHVGAYGYPRETTPVFDALAAESTLFLDATAPATWSLPSHASLFTGVFSTTHGAHAEHRALDPDGPPTLAEILGAHGYETRCFTANAWFSEALGLVRGFSWSDESFRVGRAGQTRLHALRLLDELGYGADDNGGGLVALGFESWVRSTDTEGPPTFTFVNFIEAHFPYHQVPSAHLARFTDADPSALRRTSLELMEAQFGAEISDPEAVRGPATDMYDAGVHYADHLLGRLVDALRDRGTLDDTLLIVLSDHGELLGEHGAYGHGASLHREETRVPLLVRFPRAFGRGVTVATPVSTVGVFATVLDVVGIEPPRSPEVGSLRAVVGGGPGGLVVAERYRLRDGTGGSGGSSVLFRRDARFRTYRDGPDELVITDDGRRFLFDLESEGAETRDLHGERPEVAARLHQQLSHLASLVGLAELDGRAVDVREVQIDDETRERLRALGYAE